MNLATNQTVGEIASRQPSAARVFEKHGIDYCCGGKTPLEQACRERGLTPEEIIAELERAPNGGSKAVQDWTSAPLEALIGQIVETHHGYLREALPRLSQLADKVAQAHMEKHGETLAQVQHTFQDLRAELESHMWKEEMVLFPLITGLEQARAAGRPAPPAHCGSVLNPIRVMEHEHDAAGQALADLRRLTADYALPGDACQSYRALYAGLAELETDLHQHIHLENNILFPRAAELEAALA